MLTLYNLSINSWVVWCSIADNCSTNKKIARLMGKPHVSWLHESQLGLEVNRMVKNNNDLSNIIECTYKTMRAANQKLKNAALL
jgi:hypothetical protein